MRCCRLGLFGSLDRGRLGKRERGLGVRLGQRIRRESEIFAGLVLVTMLSFASRLCIVADCGKTRSLF